jgi:ribosomal protein S27E
MKLYLVRCPHCGTDHWIAWAGKMKIKCMNCDGAEFFVVTIRED